MPESFETFKVKNVAFEFDERKKAEIGTKPKITAKLKSNHLTYSTEANSVKGLPARNSHISNCNHLILGVRRSPYQRTMLALRNKKDGTMKLVELNPVVLGAEVDFPETKNPVLLEAKMAAENPEGEGTDRDLVAERSLKKKHLVQEFGQKKGRRMYEQADRMQVEADNLKTKLNKAVENLSEESMKLHNQEKVVVLTPPCNRLILLIWLKIGIK